ncbi:MAG TPA: hypothetical protein VFT49_01075 [Candidatus Saccharimonadales bacterium]|nr:hypothetical protein [Candidatus Saccharimonadales bacterium]
MAAVSPNQFQEVYSDMGSNPLIREVYHAQFGFIQIEVPEGTDETKAEVRFLEQGWEPYQANAVGISREGFVASLSDEGRVRQFAALVLHDQLQQLANNEQNEERIH